MNNSMYCAVPPDCEEPRIVEDEYLDSLMNPFDWFFEEEDLLKEEYRRFKEEEEKIMYEKL